MGTGFTTHRFLENRELELVLQVKHRVCGVDCIQHYTERTENFIGLMAAIPMCLGTVKIL
jgi:Mg/Co/Ni transporter MgtE